LESFEIVGSRGVIPVTFFGILKKKHTSIHFFQDFLFVLAWVWHKLAACFGLIQKK